MSLALHQIAPGPNAVAAALAIATTIADPARPGLHARLAVIVEELVCNLIEHGGADGPIAIGLERGERGIALILEDDAPPFDPRAAPHLGLVPRADRGGGAGLALVRAWSRILAYSRIAGRNRLELLVLDDPDDP